MYSCKLIMPSVTYVVGTKRKSLSLLSSTAYPQDTHAWPAAPMRRVLPLAEQRQRVNDAREQMHLFLRLPARVR